MVSTKEGSVTASKPPAATIDRELAVFTVPMAAFFESAVITLSTMWQSFRRRRDHNSRFGYPSLRILARFALPTMSWLGIGSAETYAWAETGRAPNVAPAKAIQ